METKALELTDKQLKMLLSLLEDYLNDMKPGGDPYLDDSYINLHYYLSVIRYSDEN